MKLHSLRIQNLRLYKDEIIYFNDYTCIVGPNGAGKSTVLTALNLFFRISEGSSINPDDINIEDFHHKDTSNPIRITVTFTDLSPKAQDDLKDYYRHGKLIISTESTWDEAKGKAVLHQFGERMVMKAFAPYFEKTKANAKVDELRTVYKSLKESYPDLPSATTKGDMEEALQAYEGQHVDQCEELPSQDQFYGYTRGASKLQDHIQWVFIPAVKDAASEQLESKNTSLGRLLARTVRSKLNFQESLSTIVERARTDYQQLLGEQQQALEQLSESLRQRIEQWAHPDAKLRLEWRDDAERAVKIEEPLAQVKAAEGLFEGDLLRFGHGLQRSFLLALLQELATYDDITAPRLLLGIEEPELYQHPPQARHLASVLHTLSEGNAQVLLCTHSPYFVSGESFKDVRVVRKNPDRGTASVFSTSPEEVEELIATVTTDASKPPSAAGIRARIHQTLQPGLNEMFFTPMLILVEGIEDSAYISTYMHLMGKWQEFRRLGCHIVPANGKSNLIRPLAISKKFEIRHFAVFDSDADPYASPVDPAWEEQRQNNHSSATTKHKKDNLALQKLLGRSVFEEFPTSDVWEPNFTMWLSNMTKTVKTDFDATEYAKAKSHIETQYGQPGDLEKNMLAIADRLEYLWDKGFKSDKLTSLCEAILKAAT